MQSDGNSFCGDVLLDSFKRIFRDEDNILDQEFKKQICSWFYYEEVNFYTNFMKMHNSIRVALQPNFMNYLF